MNTLILHKSHFFPLTDLLRVPKFNFSKFNFSKLEWIGICTIIGSLLIISTVVVYFTRDIYFSNIVRVTSATSYGGGEKIVAGSADSFNSGPATLNLVNNFKSIGLGPLIVGEINRSEFSADGRIVTLENDNIQIYEYPDAVTAVLESESLVDRYNEKAYLASWRDQIHVYAGQNTVVFYLGSDEKILKALSQSTLIAQISPTKPSKILTKQNR